MLRGFFGNFLPLLLECCAEIILTRGAKASRLGKRAQSQEIATPFFITSWNCSRLFQPSRAESEKTRHSAKQWLLCKPSVQETNERWGSSCFLFFIGHDGQKSKSRKSTTEKATADDEKSAAAKLQAKVERFKQSRKSHSETRIVDGVAINTTVNSEVPLSVQSSAVSMKSETDLGKIQNKVRG